MIIPKKMGIYVWDREQEDKLLTLMKEYDFYFEKYSLCPMYSTINTGIINKFLKFLFCYFDFDGYEENIIEFF